MELYGSEAALGPVTAVAERYRDMKSAIDATAARWQPALVLISLPIGFALENFDAVGRWRDRENIQAVARPFREAEVRIEPLIEPCGSFLNRLLETNESIS